MAVGRGASDGKRRGGAARARHVLDDDGLPDRFRHHLADGAAGDVAKTARAKSHDDLHRARRKLLRRYRSDQDQAED